MRERPRLLPAVLVLAVAALVTLAVACGRDGTATPVATILATPGATATATPAAPLVGAGEVGSPAPEFTGITNWINSGPLTMEQLRGQVVLIDFWTYTCVNCIRTLPYLREWQEKYADKGLTIVGVHSPEFEFEKVTANVERAVEEFGLTYAIAQDNDFSTWRAYANRFWPAKYLIDAEGVIRYRHFGEGAYAETEEEIRTLLTEAGYDVSGIAAGTDPGPQADPQAYEGPPEDRITREIYGGYQRNKSIGGLYVADPEYYGDPETTRVYRDRGIYLNQFINLQGAWTSGLEALRHARETENHEDYIAFRFLATSVNAVVGFEGEPYEVQVAMDGRPLTEAEAAPDVVVEEDRSYFVVDEARMYEVVALSEFGTGVLKLSSNSDQFSFFALTFGAYDEGP